MDRYEVDFSGKNLLLERLIDELPELAAKIFRRRGDDFYIDGGVKKQRVRAGTFAESSIIFASEWDKLIDMLEYIDARKNLPGFQSADDVIVWALLERESQINGEISIDEINKLSSLGASYCWTVIAT